MHPNAQMIERFYFAFQNRDHRAMAESYAADAQFSDPVFTDLRGWHIGAMWHMLCVRGTDLKLEFSNIEADDKSGRAHWEARYTFSKTKRPVHNIIEATFVIEGGKIKAHRDQFSLWRWLGMAIGPTGKLLGWLPTLQNAVRMEAQHSLEMFIQQQAAGPRAS